MVIRLGDHPTCPHCRERYRHGQARDLYVGAEFEDLDDQDMPEVIEAEFEDPADQEMAEVVDLVGDSE